MHARLPWAALPKWVPLSVPVQSIHHLRALIRVLTHAGDLDDGWQLGCLGCVLHAGIKMSASNAANTTVPARRYTAELDLTLQ